MWLALDRSGNRAFWEDFFGVMRAIALSKPPIATAITGHSPAGGCVLAVFSDYRVMAEGDFRIGLNEVQVGLPVPEVIEARSRVSRERVTPSSSSSRARCSHRR